MYYYLIRLKHHSSRNNFEFVGNKAKGQISKRVFQEKSTPNFPKNEHFLPLDTHTLKGHTYLHKLAAKSCKFV